MPARNVCVHGLTSGPSRGGDEQPEHRPQLRRRRSRRQQLVRRRPRRRRGRPARPRRRAAGARGGRRPIVVVRDREREVEDDDAGRAGREQAALARIELARARRRRPRAGRARRRREDDPQSERAPTGGAGTRATSCVSTAGRYSPSMGLRASTPPFLFLAQALLLELAQLFVERGAHARWRALSSCPAGGTSSDQASARAARASPSSSPRSRAPRRRARARGAGRRRRRRAPRPRAARAPARAASAAARAPARARARARRGAAASRRRPSATARQQRARLPSRGAARAASPGETRYDGAGSVDDVAPPRRRRSASSLGPDPRVARVEDRATALERRSRPPRAVRANVDPRRVELERQRVALGGTHGLVRQRSTYVVRT